MPTDPAAPEFPSRETLIRFFRRDPRSAVPLAEVARLLGTDPGTVEAMLRAEGGHGRLPELSWSEAAAYLFDAWPRAQLLDTLGPSFIGEIPPDFYAARVDWSIPAFLVRALEHQAARDRHDDPRLGRTLPPGHPHTRTLDDYVADLLYAAITPETVHALRDDPDFVRAFRYPDGD